MKRSWTSWHGSRASYAGIWVTRFGWKRRIEAGLPDGRDRIVRQGHGPHRANHSRTGCRADCLTAGALKPSADRLLRHSTSAEVYRD